MEETRVDVFNDFGFCHKEEELLERYPSSERGAKADLQTCFNLIPTFSHLFAVSSRVFSEETVSMRDSVTPEIHKPYGPLDGPDAGMTAHKAESLCVKSFGSLVNQQKAPDDQADSKSDTEMFLSPRLKNKDLETSPLPRGTL